MPQTLRVTSRPSTSLFVSFLGAVALGAAIAAPSHAQIEHGRVDVIQNGAGNTAAEVTVTRAGGTSAFDVRAGSSRGDYFVQFSADPANDPTNGVMVTSIRDNGRDNAIAPNVGGNGTAPAGTIYGTSASSVSGGYFVPVHASTVGSDIEFNNNVAVAQFRFADGWLGGRALNSANNTQITSLVASPGIDLGDEFRNTFDPTTSALIGGVYELNLTGLGANSQNGLLLAGGAKNEDNFGLSRANADGTFTLFCKDNEANNVTYEADPVSFVYIPQSAPNITGARILGDGSSALSMSNAGAFTVALTGTGEYLLQIAGQTDTTGTLLVSSEGGGTTNVDNIVSYQYSAADNGWRIQTRDLPAANLQTVPAAEASFTFAFLPDSPTVVAVPEPGTLVLLGGAVLPVAVLLARRRRRS